MVLNLSPDIIRLFSSPTPSAPTRNVRETKADDHQLHSNGQLQLQTDISEKNKITERFSQKATTKHMRSEVGGVEQARPPVLHVGHFPCNERESST